MKNFWKIVLLVLSLALVIGTHIKETKERLAALDQARAIEQQNEGAQDEEDAIEAILAQLSLEEKVGQLFFGRVPLTNQLEDLETYSLGGYILFGRDMAGESWDSLRDKIAGYQSVSKTPLLIGSDEEGGSVSRLSALMALPFESPQTLYQAEGLEAVLADTKDKADFLNDLGIGTGFFPVADISADPGAYIYPRTLGADLETTRTYIAQTVAALKDKRIASTLKHFPGYGSNADSHTDLVYDERSLEELQSYDLEVFRAGIAAGADSVLVSHNILTQIDDQPASLSPVINQLLREDLGFDGVVMTDDFDMEGLAWFVNQEEGAFLAIQAGNDMILTSHYASQIPYLLDKVATGELTEERIDQSVRRILKLKQGLGLLDE